MLVRCTWKTTSNPKSFSLRRRWILRKLSTVSSRLCPSVHARPPFRRHPVIQRKQFSAIIFNEQNDHDHIKLILFKRIENELTLLTNFDSFEEETRSSSSSFSESRFECESICARFFVAAALRNGWRDGGEELI